MNQELTKALHDLEFLVRDLTDAHRLATQENPLGAILIAETLAQAVAMRGKVALMVESTKEAEA